MLMVRIGAALVVSLLAAGCFRSVPPPVEPVVEPSLPSYHEPQGTYAHARFHGTRQAPGARSLIAEALDKLGQFTDDMCACTDRTCADRVSQDMTRWSTELSATHEELKPTEEEMEEAKRVTERLSTCMMTAMGYGAPPAPPPPPPPAPPDPPTP
jgi:hypothetical protein